MSNEQETAGVETGTSPKKLSAVGGFLGTVFGSRRGVVGAVAGGFVGGTLGYLTGAKVRNAGNGVGTADPEPVAIDVAEPDENA